jgi:tRNA pseudouridine55 synthase
MDMQCGLLNMNKPSGVTSRWVVDQVQRLARPKKVGHAGTLDPLASGVLVVCVGAATRLIEYVQQMRKSYTATFLLGRHSPTEDVEGAVTLLENPPIPSLAQIVAEARALTGTILQRPPDFSALKVEGRRAYDLARRGQSVALEPRNVEVYAIDVECYAYPELRLRIDCGSGTYVRSLGRDLAEKMGTASVMSALVRTAIGNFRLADAVAPKDLTPDSWTQCLLSPSRAVETLSQVRLSEAEVLKVRLGQTIARPDLLAASGEIAALAPEGDLVAILTPRSPGMLRPLRVMPFEQG